MPPLANSEEEQLIRWYQEHVLVHREALRSYVRSSFPAITDPDNIVQEALARILEVRRAGPIPSPRSYLYSTVRNAAIDVLRRRKIISIDSLAEIEALPVLDDKPSVPEIVGTKLDLEHLTEALQSLPDRCRQVLTLRKIYGLSQREIAARLGISEHTVEAQVANGMKRCAEFMRKRGVIKERETP